MLRESDYHGFMREKISATEAARSFSDVLNRVRYKGESFVILRNGEEAGLLSPVSEGTPKTLRELVGLVRELGFPDDRFADDLEAIRREAPPLPEGPWPSS